MMNQNYYMTENILVKTRKSVIAIFSILLGFDGIIDANLLLQVMKAQPGTKSVTSGSVLMSVVRNEGFFRLYNGLSAGLLRQATYTTTRLGIYTWLFEIFSSPDGKPPSFFMKAALGMAAGATGAFVGTPAEVILVFKIRLRLSKAEYLKQKWVSINWIIMEIL